MTAASRERSGADVPIRDASTVVLLRDGATGVEPWLLTRVTALEFAAGMSVFPGGRVDDGDVDLPMTGSLPSAEAFAPDEAAARTLIGAAVRETFEETGVLLTVPPAELPDSVADVEQGRVAFGDLLREHGLAVDAGALRPWSRWVTPAGETSRRYDTRFFVAALPAGQRVGTMSREADRAVWAPLSRVLASVEAGEAAMMPPTIAACREVSRFAASDVVAAAADRTIVTVLPELVVVDGQPYLETYLGEPS